MAVGALPAPIEHDPNVGCASLFFEASSANFRRLVIAHQGNSGIAETLKREILELEGHQFDVRIANHGKELSLIQRGTVRIDVVKFRRRVTLQRCHVWMFLGIREDVFESAYFLRQII